MSYCNISTKFPPVSLTKLILLRSRQTLIAYPYSKVRKKNLWPVLCAIANVERIVVFPVVLAYGSCKPNDFEFLEDIVYGGAFRTKMTLACTLHAQFIRISLHSQCCSLAPHMPLV